MPILFAFVAFFGWATCDVFGTVATRKIGGYLTTLSYLVLQILLFGFLSVFFLENLKHYTPGLLGLNLLLGVIGTVGLITFYESLRLSNASLAGTIAASFASVTVVLSIIFLKESVRLDQTIAIVIIFAGIIISSLNFKDLKSAKIFTDRGVMLAIITMILWGVYWTFIKIPVREVGWFWPSIIANLTFPIILIFMKFRSLPFVNPLKNRVWIFMVANAILQGGGTLSYNYAIQRGMNSIVAPIAGSYPTLFVLLAFLVFKDKITRQQILGIAITLTGIVLLSLFSI